MCMPDLANFDTIPPLTSRERDVLGLTLEGLNKKAIALRLGISWRTVETYWVNIYEKVGVHSNRELLILMLTQVPRLEGE